MALEKQLSVFFFFFPLSQPPEGHSMLHSGSGEPTSTLGGGVQVQRVGRQCDSPAGDSNTPPPKYNFFLWETGIILASLSHKYHLKLKLLVALFSVL